MQIIGIDPGIRDTGAVSIDFEEDARLIVVSWLLVQDADVATGPDTVARWVGKNSGPVFVEKYNPRPGMPTNAKMVELEHNLRAELPKGTTFVNNTGVKQIITRELMMLHGVWTFGQRSHHQDLRSAARIGLYGAVKEDVLNELIADVVQAKIYGSPWTIELQGGEVV